MTRCLYEQPIFRMASGAELRPGGLRLTDELAAECALEPGQRVLDMGCGVGATASFLARSRRVGVVGLDRSAERIAEARARDQEVTWVTGRADKIDYADDHFDAVFCECFLSTVDEPIQVLREVRRVLRPTGALAVSDLYLREPDAVVLPMSLTTQSCLRGARDKEAAVALLEDAGFVVEFWRDRSEALKGLMAALVFAYGSAAAFWEAALGEQVGLRAAVERSRPGYYLAVARLSETGR